jgi:tripartite-type tricarboxylate transporter receptor subunit TctC
MPHRLAPRPLGRRLLLGAAAIAGLARPVRAAWPERAVRIVVPFPAGGGVDLTARLLADAIGPGLGQPIVVENRSGAGGAIGVQAVAQAAPDGHALAMTSPSTVTIGPQLRPSPYDPFALVHVARICTSPLLLIGRRDLPERDLAALIARARADPATLRVANAGVGTVTHLTAELFNQRLGVARFLHASYRGTAPALADVIAGNADIFFSDSSAWAAVEQGQVRLLAVTAAARWPRSPDTPAMQEALAGFVAMNWYGMAGPPGLPDGIAQPLGRMVAEALARPEVRRRLEGIGFDAAPLGRAEFTAFLRREAEIWREVIARGNIRAD